MTGKINILAICGSTRKTSSNLNLIKAIADLTTDIFSLTIFEGLSQLPHFNPDLDNDEVAQEVKNFRQQLRAADGILICSPEYAIGVPGTLKNAIDWTVSSMEFSKKPVALITASLSGEKAHHSLLGTLLIIEARMTADTQLLLPHIKSKLNNDGKIADNETLNRMNKLIHAFTEIVTNKEDNMLTAPILRNEGINSNKN